MHQVRAARTHQIAVPAAGPTALELPREEREQLRVVRHHAHQRYQRNATWMRDLLPSSSSLLHNDFSIDQATQEPSTTHAVSGASGSPVDNSIELDRLAQAASATAELAVRTKEQALLISTDYQCHVDLIASLRAIDSESSLAACQARVMEESSRYAQTTRKELKSIKL